MANDAAWQAGVDIATGNKDKKKAKGKGGSKLLDQPNPSTVADPSKYHKGGKVKKGGWAKVKKHEVVLTVGQQKAAGLKKGGKKKASHKRVAGKR